MPRCNACGNYGHITQDCVDLYTVDESNLKADLAAAKAEIARYEAMMEVAVECDIWLASGYCIQKCQDGRWRTDVEGHMENGTAIYDHPGFDTVLEAEAALQEKTNV